MLLWATAARIVFGHMNDHDLIPLPTMPWDQRPLELPLDIEECRTAIHRAEGNVSTAAELLKVPSKRLRAFVQSSPRLLSELKEFDERLIDTATSNVADALGDPEDSARRDSMTRFVLNSIGKARGWGTGGGINVNPSGPNGSITVSWGDGSSVVASPSEDSAKVIEHE